jgi:hypothetical protein
VPRGRRRPDRRCQLPPPRSPSPGHCRRRAMPWPAGGNLAKSRRECNPRPPRRQRVVTLISIRRLRR